MKQKRAARSGRSRVTSLNAPSRNSSKVLIRAPLHHPGLYAFVVGNVAIVLNLLIYFTVRSWTRMVKLFGLLL